LGAKERLHFSDVATCKDQILPSKSPFSLHNSEKKLVNMTWIGENIGSFQFFLLTFWAG